MPTAAPRRCSERAPRSASFPRLTGTSSERAASTIEPNDTSSHPRFGACRTSPSLRRTMPGTAMPMPSIGAFGGAHDTTCRISVATDAPTCQASVSCGIAASARSQTRPPSPTRATTARSTPRSTATTYGPSSVIRTPADGRPAPRRPAAGTACSVRPSVSSSVTRPAIVLRLSRIRLVSSARDSSPVRCTWRRRVPRLWRLTASWLVPVPPRPVEGTATHLLRNGAVGRSRRRSRPAAARRRSPGS